MGRSAVPVRSAILGAILAVTVVVATVTFGSSLDTLVSHPALYGWNWTYDMDGGGGLGDVPDRLRPSFSTQTPSSRVGVASTTRPCSSTAINVPVMGATLRAPVAPPLLSGHGLEARDQVVLGAGTLRQLHKRVGDTVEERAPNGAPVRLTIVGTATLPPIGVTGSSHLEMGTGAMLSYQLIPPAARNLFEVTPGPNAILIRTRGGASPAALRSIQAIGRKLDIAINGGSVLPVQRPAQIINTDHWVPRRCSWARRSRPVPSAPSASRWSHRSGEDGAIWRSSRRSASPDVSWRPPCPCRRGSPP